MVEVKENIEKIKCYLEEAEKRFGHKITLVGATKTRTSDEINYAVRSGLKTIGENKPQELRDKFDFISKDAEIHLIGHLQKNKIKYVVGKVSLIQSCDSLSLACAINEYAPTTCRGCDLPDNLFYFVIIACTIGMLGRPQPEHQWDDFPTTVFTGDRHAQRIPRIVADPAFASVSHLSVLCLFTGLNICNLF